MANQPPAECANAPIGGGPCVRLIYATPDAGVSCEWVVALTADASDVTFLDENDDAARYFMPRLSLAAAHLLMLNQSPAVYPAIARAAHVQGTVKLQVLVGPDGRTPSIQAISGPPMLTGSARDAAQNVKFKPLQIGGRSVAFQTEMVYHFGLL
jgi:TonB family protein